MGYSRLMTGPERRRRWSEDQRLALVEAAFAPGSSVAEVARQADICTSLIYRWRQSLMKEPGSVVVLIRHAADGERVGRAGAGRGVRGRPAGVDQRRRAGRVGRRRAAGVAMIALPSGVRVWLATGHTDMRRGMPGLALLVQEHLKRDPHGGDLFVFRGRAGGLIKILWHDGLGLSLYAKRLDRGRFIWPQTQGEPVALSASQLGYMLDAIDWRNPQHTWRPTSAG